MADAVPRDVRDIRTRLDGSQAEVPAVTAVVSRAEMSAIISAVFAASKDAASEDERLADRLRMRLREAFRAATVFRIEKGG